MRRSTKGAGPTRRFTGVTIITLASAVVAGCGGGDDGAATDTLQGVVVDGYLSGALVCLDNNANYACDPGEPSARTGAAGAYRLVIPELPPGELAGLRLVSEVPASAVDSDTGLAVGAPYWMSTPADRHAAISPLTTLLVEQMRVARQNGDEAAAALAARLGVADPDMLYEDFAGPAALAVQQRLHAVATVVARGLSSGLAAVSAASAGASGTEDRAAIMALVSSHLLGQVDSVAAAVSASGGALNPDDVALEPLTIDASTLDGQLLDARFIAVTDLEAALAEGWCGAVWRQGDMLIPRTASADSRGYSESVLCHALVGGSVESILESWNSEIINYVPVRSAPSRWRLAWTGGNWVGAVPAWPASVSGNTVTVEVPGGSETWDVKVLAVDDEQTLLRFPAWVSTESEVGGRIFRVTRHVTYGERLAEMGALPATVNAAAGGLTAASMDQLIQAAGTQWLAYDSFIDSCCEGNVWDEVRVVRLRPDGSAERGLDTWWNTELVYPEDGSAPYEVVLPPRAEADGTWRRETLLGLDVVRVMDASGATLALFGVHDGKSIRLEHRPASAFEETGYVGDDADAVSNLPPLGMVGM